MAAALGVMFDRVHWNKEAVTAEQIQIIDTFFDSILSGMSNVDISLSPTYITYGTLLQALDTSRRWVYTGSVTTPPCATKVYWNVLRTVYPIKQRHLDIFKIMLNRNDSSPHNDYDLRKSGNWRLIQT